MADFDPAFFDEQVKKTKEAFTDVPDVNEWVESRRGNAYKAHYFFPGFNRVDDMVGHPNQSVGFSIPAPASLETRATLSIYFMLTSFDGENAYYSFSGWRQM